MASSGPNSPGTLASSTTGFSNSWLNPGNAGAPDNIYTAAGCGSFNGGSTYYLQATNFGFSIPSGATIDGIVVEVERKANAGSTVKDTATGVRADNVKLIKAGSAVGSSKADTGTFWPTSDTYKTYGGTTDLWGTTWTDTDINNSGFGFQISADAPSSKFATAYIDYICITVYYTAGGGGTVSAINGTALASISAINGTAKASLSAINGQTL